MESFAGSINVPTSIITKEFMTTDLTSTLTTVFKTSLNKKSLYTFCVDPEEWDIRRGIFQHDQAVFDFSQPENIFFLGIHTPETNFGAGLRKQRPKSKTASLMTAAATGVEIPRLLGQMFTDAVLDRSEEWEQTL